MTSSRSQQTPFQTAFIAHYKRERSLYESTIENLRLRRVRTGEASAFHGPIDTTKQSLQDVQEQLRDLDLLYEKIIGAPAG